ncbi:MAG TPA: amidohydrolase family protein [Candidatus Deferrimicrobium sp.]|nr:amidohydrolase family protein [Candidatus Deferrimicrobium sp.]
MADTKRRIIDADGHVAEDGAAIIAHMPAAYREKARAQHFNPFPPFDHLHAGHLVDMPPGAFNRKVGPPEWLEFLDAVGVEATVLYPTAGVASSNIVNPDWAIDSTRAYNDWLYGAYLQRSPRFQGLALLPQALLNPQAAADELRRAVTKLGMCGAVLPSNSLHGPPLGTPTYLPIYEAANELGCCIAIHGGVHGSLGMDGLDPYAAVHAIGHPLGQMISLASIVFNGVLERFPRIRFGFLEGGVAWFLFCLERFDRSYETHVMRDPRGSYLKLQLGEKVSDYISRHVKARRIFVGCEGGEPLLATAVKMLGAEPFMYSSDFPHEVNSETCRHELDELIENEELSEADKEAILHRNAVKFYNL